MGMDRCLHQSPMFKFRYFTAYTLSLLILAIPIALISLGMAGMMYDIAGPDPMVAEAPSTFLVSCLYLVTD